MDSSFPIILSLDVETFYICSHVMYSVTSDYFPNLVIHLLLNSSYHPVFLLKLYIITSIAITVFLFSLSSVVNIRCILLGNYYLFFIYLMTDNIRSLILKYS